MRALVLHEIGALRVEERPAPDPGDGEVLIRVAATGICGSDVHGYTGENGRRFPGQIMGHEAAGRIAALGAGVPSRRRIGEPVTFNPVVVPEADADAFTGREQHHPGKTVIGVAPEVPAAFADYLVVPARNVVPLPDGLPVEHGALIEPLAVAVHAVRRVRREGDDRALVIGGGPIGQSLVLALRMHGIDRIQLSEIDPARRALCERLGATVIDPAESAVPDALTGGPVGLAFDVVGTSGTVGDALAATAPDARICLVGMASPRIELDAFGISTGERTLTGSFTYSAGDFADAAGHVGSGAVDLADLISREVRPETADAAFAGLARGDGTPGKVLIRFDR